MVISLNNEVGNQRIAVIILTINQKEMTLRCLSSLLALKEPKFQVILWDNGSQDGTIEAVQNEYPEVITHYYPSNLGVASGRNAAAELALKIFQPSHLLFLDNDIQVEPGFVRYLLEPFHKNEKTGQTQAKLYLMESKDIINDGGGVNINFISWQSSHIGYGEYDRGQYDKVKRCVACGGAMMVRSNVFKRLKGFDSIFDPYGPEDLDFSLRMQKIGYDALYIPQAIGFHVVSHSYGKGYTEEYARHKSHNWLLFMHRHASLQQKVCFYLVGAPYLAFRVIVRELRKGNLTAIRGLIQGVFDYF